MRRGKWIIVALTVLFAVTVFMIEKEEIGTQDFPFSVKITSDSSQEKISCVKVGDAYYVFLPSYAAVEDAQICANRVYEVSVDGIVLSEGLSCGMFPENRALELNIRSGNVEECSTVTLVRSASVGTMFIDVSSGSMEYIHQKKGNAEAAAVRIYTPAGQLNYAGSAETVKGRGNATWDMEKKPYSVELLQEADLLGMGSAKKWVLLSNVYDSTHIRGKVAYDTAAAAGLAYSPQCNWVDLYLNGEYAGLYLLSERNEIHPQRVQLPTESSFLVSQEYEFRLYDQGYPYIETDNRVAFRIHHSAISQQELEDRWQSVENAIFAEDGVDPLTGKNWQELIDLDSWAHRYLLDELFGNFDGGFLSQFYYCDTSDPEARIYAGPIWDMDNCMGANRWVISNPCSFLANRAHFSSREDVSLFYELYQKQPFYDRVVELFVSVYEPLFQELINGGLQHYAGQISQAAVSDQLRWCVDPDQNEKDIADFLQKRMDFFRDLWINGTEYCRVDMAAEDFFRWGCYMVKKGDCLTQLPEGQWYDMETNAPIDPAEPIVTDRCIYQP